MSFLMGFIALTWWIWAAALYGTAFYFVVSWAIRYARKNGKSAKRWGWGAAIVMYSIVFWDWIPTILLKNSFLFSAIRVAEILFECDFYKLV
jgi:hypothetical protein